MTTRVFLEVVLLVEDFAHGGRDEIEDLLQEALEASAMGEVTGGGSGMGATNIDIEVEDLSSGLALVRRVLKELGVARSTIINQYEPERVVHQVYTQQLPTSAGSGA